MPPTQKVLFTALPNGREGGGGRWRLSVHVSPRLGVPGQEEPIDLGQFPTWQDWPKVVNAIEWTVQLATGPQPVDVAVVSPPASSARWKELFGEFPPLRPFQNLSLADQKVRSYPVRNVQTFIRTLYTKIALEDPEDYPDYDKVTLLLAELDPTFPGDPIPQARRRAGKATAGKAGVEAQLQANKAVTDADPGLDTVGDFYQLDRFHKPRISTAQRLAAPIALPPLDFHEAISTIGQHPPLMRLLGLVVDLTFDFPENVVPVNPNEVWVVPNWNPPAGGSKVSVRTRCLIAGAGFAALPRENDPELLVTGKLPLSDTTKYTVLHEDIDGAAMKLLDFAGNMLTNIKGTLSGQKSSASPDKQALPSLRAGGLGIARINRAPEFVKRVGRQDDLTDSLGAPDPIVVDAEDVTRGYRFDIRDVGANKWFSLSARTGEYKFSSGDVPFTDEGWTTAAPTEDEAEDLYLQQTLFRWGGWSLAAPRPGGRLAVTDDKDDPQVTTAPTPPDPTFPIEIRPRVTPGSLPRLRFGHEYRIRARAVDLAGNGPPLNPDTADAQSSPPVVYTRLEPMASPPVLPFAKRTPGESLEWAVLRSNWNTLPDPNVVVARHIVPPKTSQLTAEEHGMFDTGPGSTLDLNAYSTITKYPTPAPADPKAAVVQSEQGDFLFSSEGLNDPDDHTKSRYFPLELVSLPYLPDPKARGAALRIFYPGQTGLNRVKIAFDDTADWPRWRPIRLVLRPPNEIFGPGQVDYEEVRRQLYVHVDKGDVVKVRLSSYVDEGDLPELAIWQWMGQPANFSGNPVNGSHWMMTPYRELTLVHAVQQPLKKAEFALNQNNVQNFSAVKEAGDTFVIFFGSLDYSRKSTSHIDVNAEWGEWIDLGPGTGLPTDPSIGSDPQPRRAVAFRIPGDRKPSNNANPDVIPFHDGSDPNNPVHDRQEFGDTKHRKVTYSTVATTSFAEYFTRRQIFTMPFPLSPNLVTNAVVNLNDDGLGVVPGSVSVKNHVQADPATGRVKGAGTYVEGEHFEVDVAAGKVVLRGSVPGGVPSGQKVVISYLVPPVVRPGPGEEMTPATRDILSSARPAAPKPLYVVPTFGWQRTSGPQFLTHTSTRSGRGLRVYLERPWWSSGEGELLAVIVVDGTLTPAVEPHVTRWGLDPVFLSRTTITPVLNPFLDVVTAEGDLTAPGVDGLVAAFGHAVHFDKARDLWFCDIRVNFDSYFPFIRLALARYQPKSLPSLKLSPIVLTDFIQLTPDRAVSTTPANFGSALNVTVTGESYAAAGTLTNPAVVRAWIEKADPNVPGTDPDTPDEMAWSLVGSVVTLNSSGPAAEKVWTGQVPIPPGTGRKRLVVQEVERHRTGIGTATGERVVFLDTIRL